MRAPPSIRLVSLLLWLIAGAATAATLSGEHQDWLEEVAVLILPEEREVFVELERDYQRASFIDRFWQVRDPYPETGRNEFHDEWQRRLEMARERFGDLTGDRARTILIAGPPGQILSSPCPGLLAAVEIWRYGPSRVLAGGYRVVFAPDPVRGGDRLRHWEPSDGFGALIAWSDRTSLEERDILQRVARDCPRGREVVEALRSAVDPLIVASETGLLPTPDSAWAEAFLARSILTPGSGEAIEATLDFQFPGRRGSRTVVQGLLAVPLAEAAASSGADLEYLVDGEILRAGELFERFRYRFDIPAERAGSDRVHLVIERNLRPGDYTLILRLQEPDSGRYFLCERQLQVPLVRPPDDTRTGLAREPVEEPRLAEANQTFAIGDHSLRLLPPPQRLLTDKLRVEAVAQGEGVHQVRFFLNGKAVLSKSRPPFSVELDLGRAPRLHMVEAVALDAGGRELARDRIPVNAGPHRFAVRLLEPRRGGQYERSLRARAEVDLPRGEFLDRVEFFVNEDRLATLYQPPFVQPMMLPSGKRITFVRAVAYLEDGNSAEDLVIVNAPQQLDRLQVDLVELYTSVVDRHGRPVEDLEARDFTVLEEGLEQEVLRFERLRDLPIHAGILLDCSSSMLEELPEAVAGAQRFFEGVIRPRDRAAVVVFNDEPDLRVPFTSRHEVLAGGLAHLETKGETSLWDSLVFTLHYFSGIRSKRAVILLTDGRDSNSRHSFAETMEFARRSGVAIYAIGINLPAREVETRARLQRLASETGGDFFFITFSSELKSIYRRIEDELRSQYLLAYQSSHPGSTGFRRVEIRLRPPGLEAKSIPGYYP